MYAFQCAEQWTGKAIEFVDEVPESTGLVERMNQDSRRDAISGLLSAVGDIASGHYRTEHDSELREFEAQRAESRATAWRNEDFDHPLNQAMRKAGRFKSMFPRREFLVDMLQINPNIGSNISLTISSTDSSLCTNAHDCVASCITGARGIDDDGWLTFDSRYCIGCGICVTACRQRACSLVEITADDLSSEHVIADIEQIREARREKAVRLSDDGRKRAIDADSIYGVAEL
ncbi:MAG: ATP-binding protein [Eggerthellaceae bacterium]